MKIGISLTSIHILWIMKKTFSGQDNKGEYYHRLVFMMYVPFLAGKILHEDPAPVPKELFERIDVIKKKAEANKLLESKSQP